MVPLTASLPPAPSAADDMTPDLALRPRHRPLVQMLDPGWHCILPAGVVRVFAPGSQDDAPLHAAEEQQHEEPRQVSK